MNKNASGYQFSIATSLEDLQQLKPDWDTLHTLDKNQLFFTDWRWVYCVKKHLLTDCIIVSGRVDGKLIAALPLTFNHQTKTISLACSNQTDLNDYLVSNDHGNEAFIKHLFTFFDQTFKQWTAFECRPVLDDSTTTSLAERIKLKIDVDPYLSNFWFDTKNADSLSSISKKHIKNISRLERKLISEHGALTFCHTLIDPVSINKFFELESNSWKAEGAENTSILATPSLSDFYLELGSLFAETGQLRLSFCQQESAILAGQFGLVSGGNLFLLKISYDINYQPYGVGNILLYDTLKAAAEAQDLTSVNLVTGPKWAERWHPQKSLVNWVKFYRASIQGLASWNVTQLKNRVRPLVNKVK